MKHQFIPDEITTSWLSGKNLARLEGSSLTFHDSNGVEWIAPEETLTDGASVPRVALSITNGRFQDEFLKAAILHDAYCQTDNAARSPPYRSRPWRDVHRMFYDACLAGGTSKVKALVMYSGVRYFGPRWDDPDSEKQQLQQDAALVAHPATKNWIEEAQPSLDDIDADVERREIDIARINDLQMRAIGKMFSRESDARDAARQLLTEAHTLIEVGYKQAPDDLMYLNLIGYQYKNWAMLYPEYELEALSYAEHYFGRVLAKDPDDPSANNGMGSVAMLAGKAPEARKYIERALEIQPNYAAAQHDLLQVMRLEKK